MKKLTEAELIDYLAGELPADRHAEVTDLLATDPQLAAEARELRGLLQEISDQPEPEPSSRADDRFESLLADAIGQPPRRQVKVRSLIWKVVGIAAAIALVFAAGRFYQAGSNADFDRQLAANRTLMLELMQAERSSDRIEATVVATRMAAPDSETTEDLGYLLRSDDNTNVRLAALTALRRFAEDAGVRNELLRALAADPPLVVRIELVELLVSVREQRALPYLEELMRSDSLPRPVRDLARLGAIKLI